MTDCPDHRLHKFHCLESSDEDFPRTIEICFRCGKVFTSKVVYDEVELKLT